MIDPTDEMLDEMLDLYETVRRAYWTAHDHEAAGMTVAEHHRAAARPALKAVLAIVERDRCMEPKGHVRHPSAKPKGWLIEHVDHHEDAPVEECTFCAPAPSAADGRHYNVACPDRPYCRIPEHHEGGVL